MHLSSILETTIYFLALINPPSKILLLSAHKPPFSRKQLTSISLRSTMAALFILVLLTSAGNFILERIFHVEIYSLSVAGGIILFLIGLTAVRQGSFYEDSITRKIDITIVPLAAPLIAGPGIITAAISFSSMHGVIETLLCLIIALFVNFVCMLFSRHIGRAMERINATGPVIRITGLIVTAVAVQMIFSGCGTWIEKILTAH
jgi:multiple antibiotic resistance protein